MMSAGSGRRKRAIVLVLAAVVVCALAACGDGESVQGRDAAADVAPAVAALDLVVIVADTEPGPKQEALRVEFASIANRLGDLTAPVSLHLGILTTDLGAGRFTPGWCPVVGGDRGAFQNTPAEASPLWGPPTTACSAAQGFLRDPADRFLKWQTGPEADANFAGTLADAFSCYAGFNDMGCKYLQPLESMRAALAGCDAEGGCDQPVNNGFLRPEAALAVVMLVDEDDCSGPADSSLYSPETTDALGPPLTYRCFEFSVLCEGQPVGRTAGERTDCIPGEPDPDPTRQLSPVEEYVDFLRGLKGGDPSKLYVGVVAGPPTPVVVDVDTYPQLGLSCSGPTGGARPCVRLAAFTDEIGGRFVSACDVPQALGVIADDLAARLARSSGGTALLVGPGQTRSQELRDRRRRPQP